MELLGRVPNQTITHERMPLTSRPTSIGTESQCLKLANELINQTQAWLYERDADCRADLLRDFTSELTRGIQNQAARLMTTLFLVGHYLPQPYAIGGVTSQARSLGRNYTRDVLALIAESFDNNTSGSLGNGPLGIDEVVPLVPALNPSALMAMSFPENATALFDEMTPTQEGEGDSDAQGLGMLPPHAPRKREPADDVEFGTSTPRPTRAHRVGPQTQTGGSTSSSAPATTSVMLATPPSNTSSTSLATASTHHNDTE